VISEERQRSKLGSRFQRYLGTGIAIIVSLISLGVALSANRTQERLLAASVWPSLEYGTGNRDDQARDVISLEIGNNGVGPARLRGIQVVYRGERARNAVDLLKRCCGLGDEPVNTVTSGTRGRVLKAGDTITLLMLYKELNARDLWARFDRERFEVGVRACYCSVLDDCWIYDSARADAEPDPIASCPRLDENEEWSG
jgi:hypothetical protein